MHRSWTNFNSPAARETTSALPAFRRSGNALLHHNVLEIRLMMMAALTMTGVAVRNAGAAKNILAGVINAAAVVIFIFSRDVHWLQTVITAIGASFGGWAGALMLRRVNEKLLKLGVVAIGVALTIGLFWTAP